MRDVVPSSVLHPVRGRLATCSGVRRAVLFCALPALLALLLLASTACGGGAPVATPAATSAAAAPPTPYALPKDAPAYTGTVEAVTGLSIDPVDTVVASTQSLPPVPASTLPAWDGHSVVLYDLRSGTATNLGNGALGFGLPFSADGTHLTWQVGPAAGSSQVANSQVWVVDLQTMKRTAYGDGAAASFGSGGTLRVATLDAGRLTQRTVSLSSGKDVAAGPAVDAARLHEPDGYVLERTAPSKKAPLLYVWRIVPDDGGPALSFDASDALPLDGQRAVLAVLRTPGSTANVYRIDVGSTAATFVATVHALPRTMPPVIALRGGLVAIGDRVSCDDPNGRVLLYDATSGTLRAIHTTFAPVDVGGGSGLATRLGIDGNLGAARAVIDPATLTYGPVLPAAGFFSADGRWAVVGPSVAMSTDACHSSGSNASAASTPAAAAGGG